MSKSSGMSYTQRWNGNGNFGVVRNPAASDHKVSKRYESEGIFRQGGVTEVKQDSTFGRPVTPLEKSGRQTPHKGSSYSKTSVRRSGQVPVFRLGSEVKPDTYSPFQEKRAQPSGRPRRLSQPHTQRFVQ